MLNDCLINKRSINSVRQSLIDRGTELKVLARETEKDEE